MFIGVLRNLATSFWQSNPFALGQTVTMVLWCSGRRGWGLNSTKTSSDRCGGKPRQLRQCFGQRAGINRNQLGDTSKTAGTRELAAIPSNRYTLMNEIKDHGKITRGKLGVGRGI
jgi:hypothetical protein